jgi:predicted amidohydrolase YtcJ
MSVPGRLALLLLVAIVGFAVPAPAANQSADFVYRNGVVYTMSATRSWAEAVAVSSGKVVYVGTNTGVARWVGPQTKVVDLAGRMLLPSFRDSHVHPVESGIELSECRLYDAETPEAALAAVRDYVAKHPNDSWIRGGGWQLPVFPDANPHKSLLDAIEPKRPVFLAAADGHSAWVNSRALEIAGITAATPDPPNGRIERDPKTKEPTGTLRESASWLVSKHLPAYTDEQYREGLRAALKMAAGFGITALHDASADDREMATYDRLARAGELTARVRAALSLVTDGERPVARLVELRGKYASRLLRPEAVKIFADGVIEAQTSALLEPYVGKGDDRGALNFEPDALRRIAIGLDRAGFQIHVHAIGDRAVRAALDAFEAARNANGARDSRHEIAHLELIDPSDVPRFRALGVTANFQPLWAYGDSYIKKLTVPVLGPERSSRLYPIGSLVKSGAVVAFGSDWSVSSMNPLDAIQVAVTRRGLDGNEETTLLPEQAITLADALAGYTIAAAYADFDEAITGSVEVGKSADLIVLDKNLFAIPATEIHKARVVLTLFEGRETFRDPAF